MHSGYPFTPIAEWVLTYGVYESYPVARETKHLVIRSRASKTRNHFAGEAEHCESEALRPPDQYGASSARLAIAKPAMEVRLCRPNWFGSAVFW